MLPPAPWARTSLRFGFATPAKEFTVMDMFWLPGTTVGPTFDVDSAAMDFYTTFSGLVLSFLGTDCVTIGSHVLIAGTTFRRGASHYDSAPGTGTGTSLPEQESAVVTLSASAAGRHGTGHLRFAGVAEGMVVGNYVTTPGLSAMQTLCAAIVPGWVSGGVTFGPVLWNRTTGALSAVVSASPLALIGSQRRRAPRF